jgi:hypothetical protein
MKDLNYIRILLSENNISGVVYYLRCSPEEPEGVPFREAWEYVLAEVSKNPSHLKDLFLAVDALRFYNESPTLEEAIFNKEIED